MARPMQVLFLYIGDLEFIAVYYRLVSAQQYKQKLAVYHTYRYEFDIGDNSSYENVFSNLIKWLAIIFSSKNIAFHHFYFLMNA